MLKERGSAADMPEAVVERHRRAADAFFKYMEAGGELPELPDYIIEGESQDLELTPPGE
ncbi:MAG: hypothetical protein ACE5LX_07965 [Nitrospinota bacterium]